MNATGRIETLDLMKGLVILLVVMQHLDIVPNAHESRLAAVYLCFNMPMFFFVSGMFLPVGRTTGSMLRHSARRLLVPWLFFAVAGGLIVDVLVNGNYYVLGSPRRIFHWFAYGPNVPLYFLRALFLSTVGCFFAARAAAGLRRQLVVLALLVALSAVAFRVAPHVASLPGPVKGMVRLLALPEAMAMSMYLWLGHMAASNTNMRDARAGRLAGACIMAAALGAALLTGWNAMRWHTVWHLGSWGGITACAVCGIAAVWGAALMLRGCRPLALAGRYSLAIMCSHYVLIYTLTGLLAVEERNSVWPLVLLLFAPLAWACVRFLPWALGMRKKR